jgi:hypothetical protein
MTLQPGDKVQLNGAVTWVVVSASPAWVYLTCPDMPKWGPVRVTPDQVTCVLRGNEWVAISPPAGE